MDAGFKASMEVFAEHEAKSPEFKKIHQDMRAFQRDQLLWTRFSEYRFDRAFFVPLSISAATMSLQKAACRWCQSWLTAPAAGARHMPLPEGKKKPRANGALGARRSPISF
jgi:hypothetical protein